MDSNKKYWASINLDEIKVAMQKAEKKFKKSEQYGHQMSADVKVWDDGNASISISYQDESGNWQRINIGSIRESKLTNDYNAPANTGASAPANNSFDSPF